jgi:YfiH family protein
MVFIAQGFVAPAPPDGRTARWAATGRSGGESSAPYDTFNLAGYVGDDPAAVERNRSTVARGLGLAPSAICLMDSVHGAEVMLVDSPGVVVGVDVLVTQCADLAIAALGADCVPLALVGVDGITVSAVHCGWRGLVLDAIGAGVRAVRDCGSEIALAVLGPAVCGRCYPVPVARADQVRRHTSVAVHSAALVRCADGQPGIDVRAGLRARLVELGVSQDAILDAGGCTVEDLGLFSYRRDGRTGRQGMVVCTRDLAQW